MMLSKMLVKDHHDFIAGMRTVDAEYKLEKNIKIAMLYLEDDNAVNAETFIKKAATLITSTKVLPYLLLMHF